MQIITVYGTNQLCPSCVQLPSSKETASWLEAALGRKYGEQVQVHYVDFQQPQTEQDQAWAQKIVDEDLWYPVVVIDNKIVAEGNPRLKEIYHILEQKQITPLNEK